MNIIFQSIHFKASPELGDFVSKKVAKLYRQNKRIQKSEVTLYPLTDKNSPEQCCEIRLHIPGNDLFVRKTSGSYENSVLHATQTLQRMMRKRKTRKLNSRRNKTVMND